MCGTRRRLPFADRRCRHSSFALDPKPLAHTDPLSPGAPQRHGPVARGRMVLAASSIFSARQFTYGRLDSQGCPVRDGNANFLDRVSKSATRCSHSTERARFRFPRTAPAAILFEASSCGANLSAQRFPSAATSLDSEAARDARLSVQLVWGALVVRVEAANPPADGPFVATPDQWPTTIRVLARDSLLLVAAALICSDLTAGISPYCIRAWKG